MTAALDYLRAHAALLTDYERERVRMIAVDCTPFTRAADAVFIRTLRDKVEDMAKRAKTLELKSPPSRRAKKAAATFPVKFAAVNVTSDKVRIGVTVARTECSRDAADDVFVDGEVRFRMTCDPNAADDARGQTKFTSDDLNAEVTAIVGGVKMKRDRFTFGLSIARDNGNTDAEHLLRFANTNGRIEAERIGDAKTKSDEKEDGETGDDPTE